MIVLDTHVWVWWVSRSQRLSEAASEAIQTGVAERAIYISSISAWEISILVRRGRLELTMDFEDWIARTEALPFVRFVPVDNHIAIRSTLLPKEIPADPADRIIVSTAAGLGAGLVTRDNRLLAASTVETVW